MFTRNNIYEKQYIGETIYTRNNINQETIYTRKQYILKQFTRYRHYTNEVVLQTLHPLKWSKVLQKLYPSKLYNFPRTCFAHVLVLLKGEEVTSEHRIARGFPVGLVIHVGQGPAGKHRAFNISQLLVYQELTASLSIG